MSKAFIQKPAPNFEGTAVAANSKFTTVKLSDYKGTMYYYFINPLFPFGKNSHV